MYEFTHKGLWFRWDALDRPSRWWAGVSIGAAAITAIPIALAVNDAGFQIGFSMAGGHAAPTRIDLLPDWLSLTWIILGSVISAVTWWRFSLLQDEMFNRVQNWALGMAGAWTSALLALWAILDLYDVAPPVHPLGVIGLFYVLTIGFWMVAVRRWA